MKDYRRYDLRQLTESIFYIREWVLKFLNPSSKEYIDASEEYEKLWHQRDVLEDEIFHNQEGE